MSHTYLVPSCDVHMQHVTATTLTEPIVGLRCLIGDVLKLYAVLSHIVCHVCDFVTGTCRSDELPPVTGP